MGLIKPKLTLIKAQNHVFFILDAFRPVAYLFLILKNGTMKYK